MQGLVSAYKDGRIGLDPIYDAIAVFIYAHPERYGFDGEDDAAEALWRYRKRIRGFAEHYVENGSTFDAYMATSMRFLAKTMRRENRKRRERELVCERFEGWQLELRDEEARFGGIAGLRLGPWSSPAEPPLHRPSSKPEVEAFRNRLVYLYLKCAWQADDERTTRIAASACVPPGWLAAAAAQCLRSLESERLRYERLVLRRDRSWSRVRLLENRLRFEFDASSRGRLLAARDREQGRLDRARTELKAFQPVVSNSVVARVLGVPKGTVDSGLYYLKKHQGGLPGL
jgi:hypothetical protein